MVDCWRCIVTGNSKGKSPVHTLPAICQNILEPGQRPLLKTHPNGEARAEERWENKGWNGQTEAGKTARKWTALFCILDVVYPVSPFLFYGFLLFSFFCWRSVSGHEVLTQILSTWLRAHLLCRMWVSTVCVDAGHCQVAPGVAWTCFAARRAANARHTTSHVTGARSYMHAHAVKVYLWMHIYG